MDGREGAIVVVTLDSGKRVDQFFIAHHESDPPACHVVTLTHGEKLNRNVARTRDLHDRGRLEPIETNIRVGEIVNHQNIVLLGQSDNPLKKIILNALRGRIAGKAQNNHLGLRD